MHKDKSDISLLTSLCSVAVLTFQIGFHCINMKIGIFISCTFHFSLMFIILEVGYTL